MLNIKRGRVALCSNWLAFLVVGKAQKRKERADRAGAVLRNKIAKGEVDLEMGLVAEAVPKAQQAAAAPAADSMQE